MYFKETIMQGWHKGIVLAALLALGGQANAAETAVDIYALNNNPQDKGVGEKIGTIEFSDSDAGLIIKPNLKGLPPGPHGFHIHEKDSCDGGEKDGQWVAGLGAGGHLDPAKSEKHLGPKGKGHLGDLPVLNVNQAGEAKEELIAPHLTVLDLRERSVVIHAGGDNYSDKPKPLGGGGDRIACGVLP